MKRKHINIQIFKSSFGSCSNGGVSQHFDTITLFEEGTSQADAIEAGIKTEKDKLLCFKVEDLDGFKRAVPIFSGTRQYMFGGCFGFCSDDFYKEISAINYPIAIHDRCEL